MKQNRGTLGLKKFQKTSKDTKKITVDSKRFLRIAKYSKRFKKQLKDSSARISKIQISSEYLALEK